MLKRESQLLGCIVAESHCCLISQISTDCLRNSILRVFDQNLYEGHLSLADATLGTGQYLWEYGTGKFATGPPVILVL